MSVADTVRIPERFEMTPISSIKSIGLLSRLGTRGTEFMVAELQGFEDSRVSSAKLFRFQSGSEAWVEEKFHCSGFNPRYTDEVISHEGRLWWVDLGKGILGCNPFEEHPVWMYLGIPNGVARRYKEGPAWAWSDDTEQTRCVSVSEGTLRFLELTAADTNDATRATTLTMWTLVIDPEDGSMSWIREFKMELSKLWEDCSYKKSHLPLKMPALAIIHPNKADVIYFFIDGRLCSFDVTAHRLLEVFTNISPFSLVEAWNGAFAPPPLSWRYLIAWELSDLEKNHLSTLSASDPRGRKSVTRLCKKGLKLGRLLAAQLGVSASSIGSSLLYLNEEVSDAEMVFKYVSELKLTGHGYVASAAGKAAKASKKIRNVIGVGGLALSYGGAAFNTMGFSLQRLHPQAQTGRSARNAHTETVTIQSIEEAKNVIKQWRDTGEVVIAEVPPQMETGLAEQILKLFKNAEALELVENSPILREKAEKNLDNASEWEIV